MIKATHIHGNSIIGYVFTENQHDDKGHHECGIVLVRIPKPGIGLTEFVTGWYRDGDREWSTGHYFSDHVAATWDMVDRAVGKPPKEE